MWEYFKGFGEWKINEVGQNNKFENQIETQMPRPGAVKLPKGHDRPFLRQQVVAKESNKPH